MIYRQVFVWNENTKPTLYVNVCTYMRTCLTLNPAEGGGVAPDRHGEEGEKPRSEIPGPFQHNSCKSLSGNRTGETRSTVRESPKPLSLDPTRLKEGMFSLNTALVGTRN